MTEAPETPRGPGAPVADPVAGARSVMMRVRVSPSEAAALDAAAAELGVTRSDAVRELLRVALALLAR